jgi:hypothetical protein
MGRTVSPFSQALSDYRRNLSRFRRQLDADEQRALDQIFESAHYHTYAAVYMASFDPSRPILLSALIEHRKRVKALAERVDVVEREVEGLKGDDQAIATFLIRRNVNIMLSIFLSSGV